MEIEANEFIKTVRQKTAAPARQFALLGDSADARAVVFVVEDAAAGEDDDFYSMLERFPTPVILALKNAGAATDEKLVAACHLCVAAEDARIGNFSAAEALRHGWINKIAPSVEVESEARALAEQIAALAPAAVRACLKAVTEGARLPLAEGLRLEAELFAEIFSTADMREGTRAFLEKRRPNFQGR